MNWHYRRIVPWGWATLLALIYSATYIVDFVAIRLNVSVPDGLQKIRFMMMMVCAAVYAGHRVLRFHPAYSPRHLMWLATSPWDITKPFPLGPPHIVWIDAVIVGAIMLLVRIDGTFSPAHPAMVFLGMYTLLWALALALTPEHLWRAAVAAFLVPLAAYPHRNPWLGMAVLAGMYLWFLLAFQKQFKDFPWNTGYWKSNPVEQLRKGFAKKEVVGWLHQMFKMYKPEIEMTLLKAIGIAALITWWFHAGISLTNDPDDREFLVFMTVGLCIPGLMIARFIAYITPGYRAPLSLLGRLLTFRWIIPRYHVIFVGPACMLAVYLAMLYFGRFLGLPEIYRFEILLFAELVMAMTIPPNRKRWHLIGAYRMVGNPKPTGRQSKIAIPVGPKGLLRLWG